MLEGKGGKLNFIPRGDRETTRVRLSERLGCRGVGPLDASRRPDLALALRDTSNQRQLYIKNLSDLIWLRILFLSSSRKAEDDRAALNALMEANIGECEYFLSMTFTNPPQIDAGT